MEPEAPPPRAQGTGLQAAGSGSCERRGLAAHLRGALITAPLPLRPPAAHLRRCRLRPDGEQGAGPRGAPAGFPEREGERSPYGVGYGAPNKWALVFKPRESGSLSPAPMDQGSSPIQSLSICPYGAGEPSPLPTLPVWDFHLVLPIMKPPSPQSRWFFLGQPPTSLLARFLP